MGRLLAAQVYNGGIMKSWVTYISSSLMQIRKLVESSKRCCKWAIFSVKDGCITVAFFFFFFFFFNFHFH